MDIKIFYGPDKDFKDFIDSFCDDYTSMNEVMLQVVNEERSVTHRTEDSPIEPLVNYYETIVCSRQEYASMTTNTINNILLLLNKTECELLIFHNPPKVILETLQKKYEVEITNHDFQKPKFEDLIELKSLFLEKIKGQDDLINLLLPIVNLSRLRADGKPVILMFYGPPGVGKTETAKIISRALYKNEKIRRFQLSMYQTEHAYQFLFGSEPQEDSLAKDLLSRDTNVILLDEFDKVHPSLYSAFYELFDEGKMVDRNFETLVNNAIFICTSNFLNKEQIKDRVGPAIYSRITECIPFKPLDKPTKEEIMIKKFYEIYESIDHEEQAILDEFQHVDLLNDLRARIESMTDSRVINDTIEKYFSYKILTSKRIL